jgi:DNA-binding transcriptional regulator YhcF (GntR family)
MIVEKLRGRILRGLQAGTLGQADRLPSARDLAGEFEVDHRVILAAYRRLADEGLVELRQRGGIYVAVDHSAEEGIPHLPQRWIVDVLEQALVREIPIPDLGEWIRRCTETLRLRAAVISTTSDQVGGICRELRDDFGLEADGMIAGEINLITPPLAIRRADVLLSTEAHADLVRKFGEDLKKPVIVVEIEPDVIIGDWALLLRQPVYAIVATPEFGEMLRSFFSAVPGSENLRIVVFGKDDLSTIPPDAPIYINQSVRSQLGGAKISGRILPAARIISTKTARRILEFVVRSNIEAMRALAR